MCAICGKPCAGKYCTADHYHRAERLEVAPTDLLIALNTLPSLEDVCAALALSRRTLHRRMAEADIHRVPGTRQYLVVRNAQWAWL